MTFGTTLPPVNLATGLNVHGLLDLLEDLDTNTARALARRLLQGLTRFRADSCGATDYLAKTLGASICGTFDESLCDYGRTVSMVAAGTGTWSHDRRHNNRPFVASQSSRLVLTR